MPLLNLAVLTLYVSVTIVFMSLFRTLALALSLWTGTISICFLLCFVQGWPSCRYASLGITRFLVFQLSASVPGFYVSKSFYVKHIQIHSTWIWFVKYTRDHNYPIFLIGLKPNVYRQIQNQLSWHLHWNKWICSTKFSWRQQ